VVTIAVEAPRQPAVLELLREGDEFALALYPAENYYGLDIDASRSRVSHSSLLATVRR